MENLYKRVPVFLFLLFFCINKNFAQPDSHISQYVFFPVAFNPAALGESGKIQIIGLQRLEHLAFSSGGQATDFGVNLPIGGGNSYHGVGLRLKNRKIGSIRSYQEAYLQYAYKRKVWEGLLSGGFDFGFVNAVIDGEKVVLPQVGEYHHSDDDKIPSGTVSGIGVDLNFGLLYSFKKMAFGFSVLHLNSPVVSIGETIKEKIPSLLFLHGNYRYDIPDRKMTLYPSTMLKTNFIVFNWDIGARLEFDEKFWGGLSYRFPNAFVFSGGMNLGNGVAAGIAYDLPTTRMIAGFGTIELFVEYAFEQNFKKQKKKYKSVRIL